MRKLLAATALVLLAGQARAADAELSPEAKSLLGYGTLAVLTKSCNSPLTSDQSAQIQSGMQKAAEAQKDLTQDQFTEAMKAVGAQVAQNRDQVCAGMTPDFIDASLKDAASGK